MWISPCNQDLCHRLWTTAQVNKKTSWTQYSTSNPKISSMDRSASSVVVEVLDICGTGSLIEGKKQSAHHVVGQMEKPPANDLNTHPFPSYLARILLMFSASFSCSDLSPSIFSRAFWMTSCCEDQHVWRGQTTQQCCSSIGQRKGSFSGHTSFEVSLMFDYFKMFNSH